MSWFCVDVEADGPMPGPYSLLSIGVVKVEPGLLSGSDPTTFYAELQPISDQFQPAALAVSGLDRDRLMREGREPEQAMANLGRFLDEHSVGRPVFVSDNPGFDFAFVNWYFHTYIGDNPFGWSSRRIGDLWAGLNRSSDASSWKGLRQTDHTHNALDDSLGNAEALLIMLEQHNVEIDLS